MNVYIHPSALSVENVRNLERSTGLMAVPTGKGNVKLAKPKPRLVRVVTQPNNDWPPFGGDAA
ncbi:hypothetical protein [Microbulbifer sp. HZ11]|uniref:hypothetical protein n=1 Tax=Microbulbifer sp. HZ11 TaxID=1453501 RepID=UPI0005BCE3DF|nr:hypothetical protein [Microbulbifer sp. HZ11]